ncbi:DUF4037 domain-containing protein [Uliginosibacterium sp. H3]|uniref:DUF4037 domain-containing protein n=1 Tax=Uliginosibacterium silvisoli TaxID=3114758 RepID=A0ABU6K2X4_9RHOO|nr:DUF4037 domain-containing protein [Uliginosibacterium sp. H3]
MKGLMLARQYHDHCIDALLAPYAGYRQRIATGLVGPGSECFGFDDEFSRDHDFGPGFCIWLADEDHAVIGPALQAGYDRLPKSFAGSMPRRATPRSDQRVGVFSISAFYTRFLGAPELPVSDADWLQIPEERLATAVNGAVFSDPLGGFSHIRSCLQGYYPETVRRRKIANAVASMAQSGQYNLPRSLQRGETSAAFLAQAEFIRSTCQLVHALNGCYTPFYKWLHRSTQHMPLLANMHARLDRLSHTLPLASQRMVEKICDEALQTLIRFGYTFPGDAFLEAHVDNILGAALPTMARVATRPYDLQAQPT